MRVIFKAVVAARYHVQLQLLGINANQFELESIQLSFKKGKLLKNYIMLEILKLLGRINSLFNINLYFSFLL